MSAGKREWWEEDTTVVRVLNALGATLQPPMTLREAMEFNRAADARNGADHVPA